MSKENASDSGRRRHLLLLLPRFAVIICSILILSYFLSYAADSLRAYAFVSLLWQASQKRAQLALTRCIAHQSLDQYPEFEKQLDVMQALTRAIKAAKSPRRPDEMRAALQAAQISPDEAEKIVRFSGVMTWLNSSITRKTQDEGDRAAIRVQRQLEIGQAIRRELQSGSANRAHLDQLLRELETVDAEADQAERAFVERMRWLVQRVTRTLFLTVVLGTLALLYFSFAEMRGMLVRLLKTEKNLRRREQQLFESRKLDAIGRLAASVAHDFNNLLMVISSAAEMIILQTPAVSRQRKLTDGILEATRQGSALTRQLLVFSHKQVSEPQVLEIDHEVEQSKQFLQHVLGPGIELSCVLRAGRATFEIDRAQFTQVLLNLATNARDAMPEGGVFSIRTLLGSGEHAQQIPYIPNGYIVLQVSDQGVGMSEETKMRIFEPFFTTKEAGKGTGLGLSTVYGVVKQCQGGITVESQLHRGTTFRLYFPRSRELARPTAPMVPRKTRRTGGETILLIEDQEAVREMSRSALEGEGYHVIAARSCEDAVELVKLYSGPIHLLLTDVVLPKLSGHEAARRIRALRPDVKVIYMSGYAPSDLFENGVVEAHAGFLQKPCSIADISRKVRQILDGAAENQTA